MNNKVKTLAEYDTWKYEFKIKGDKVVTSNGCFDLLHYGHINTLVEAKKLGDVLIVGINSDAAVAMLKGPGKPLNSEVYRALQVASLDCVDFVVVFDDVLPTRFVETIKPSVHVKGGDYTMDKIPEAALVKQFGGEVVIVPTLDSNVTISKVKFYT